MNEKDLDQQLIEYGNSDVYPFHMPGAKRQSFGLPDPYTIDLTEIEGFDNLNHPEGLYQNLNERVANLYHANRAFCMVNGSTGGNYVMLHCALRRGDTVLVARNCHKSVWHQMELLGLRTVVLNPSKMWDNNLSGEIKVEEVESLIRKYPEIKACILTSPTYEGISSDIRGISDACHKRDIPLLVDSAHGAHFTVGGSIFPRNPIEEGADLAVVSLHKTLPALTQTAAILYRENPYITAEEITERIPYYQTSSPSYVLMASVARCVRFLEDEGSEAYERYGESLRDFYQSISFQNFRLLSYESHDPSKIVIRTPEGISGKAFLNTLREKYHIEGEYGAGNIVLLISSVCDTEEGLHRLTEALQEEDRNYEKPDDVEGRYPGASSEEHCLPEKRYEITEALSMESGWQSLTQAEGEVAAGIVGVYPPGIPICLPGEVLTDEMISTIEKALVARNEVEGINEKGQIRIISRQ